MVICGNLFFRVAMFHLVSLLFCEVVAFTKIIWWMVGISMQV